jgi:hypothetical protein
MMLHDGLFYIIREKVQIMNIKYKNVDNLSR